MGRLGSRRRSDRPGGGFGILSKRPPKAPASRPVVTNYCILSECGCKAPALGTSDCFLDQMEVFDRQIVSALTGPELPSAPLPVPVVQPAACGGTSARDTVLREGGPSVPWAARDHRSQPAYFNGVCRACTSDLKFATNRRVVAAGLGMPDARAQDLGRIRHVGVEIAGASFPALSCLDNKSYKRDLVIAMALVVYQIPKVTEAWQQNGARLADSGLANARSTSRDFATSKLDGRR